MKCSLASKCIYLNSKPGLARPTHIDLNPNVLLYYTFLVSLVDVMEVVLLMIQIVESVTRITKIGNF